MQLTRDAIRAVEDLKREKLEIPEWGADAYLFVRTMTARDREQWETAAFASRGKDQQLNLKNVMTSLAVETCVDEAGEKLFVAGDVEWLAGKSCVAMQRIWDKARELNRIGKQDVDELVKNCETTPDADSPSA